MSADGLVVQQDGAIVGIVFLNQGRHFAGVKRIDSGIAVSGVEHDGGEFHARLHVLIRRVLEQVGKLVGVIGRAVFGGPPLADQEILETDHIEQGKAAPDGAEHFRMLGHSGAHEKAAVGASTNREVVNRGVFFIDQILGRGEEVVEDVLLVLEHSGLVPFFAVLATSAQIGLGEEAALLKPPRVFRIPARVEIDEEAAITGHQSRSVAVALHAFFGGDEHRNARAVFGFVENLLDLVVVGVERHLRFSEDFGLAGGNVVAINGGRDDERLEAVESFVRILASIELGGRAEGGIFEVSDLVAVESEDIGLGDDIVESGDEQLSAHDGDAGDDVGGLGDDGGPVLWLRVSDGNFDDAIVGRLIIGEQVEIVAVVCRSETVIHATDDGANGRTGLTQILRVNIDALGGDAVDDTDHQVAFILGDLGLNEFHLAEGLTFETLAEDEIVAGSGRAKLVVEDESSGLLVARVIEALFIGAELDAFIARGGQRVGQFATRAILVDLEDVH